MVMSPGLWRYTTCRHIKYNITTPQTRHMDSEDADSQRIDDAYNSQAEHVGRVTMAKK